jgi:excisionase family DNA binding protein
MPVPTQAGRLLTPDQVGQRLAVSRSMVYKLVRTRVLPALYIGRLPRIEESALAMYLERQGSAAGADR